MTTVLEGFVQASTLQGSGAVPSSSSAGESPTRSISLSPRKNKRKKVEPQKNKITNYFQMDESKAVLEGPPCVTIEDDPYGKHGVFRNLLCDNIKLFSAIFPVNVGASVSAVQKHEVKTIVPSSKRPRMTVSEPQKPTPARSDAVCVYDLYDHVLENIFCHLPFIDMMRNATRVCTRWRNILYQEKVCRHAFLLLPICRCSI